MWSLLRSPWLVRQMEAFSATPASEAHALLSPSEGEVSDQESHLEPTILRTLGWVSAALGAVALGLFVGRELRQRYHFNRRTPYDFYAHSGGDEVQDMEFGLGI